MKLVCDRRIRQIPPAPHSLQGLVLAALLPQPFRLVALTGALKTGLAEKGEEGHSRESSEPPIGGRRAWKHDLSG